MTVTKTRGRRKKPAKREFSVAEMMADMDAAIIANGLDPAKYGKVDVSEPPDDALRKKNKKPGAGTGRGIVRGISEKQAAFIRRLLNERAIPVGAQFIPRKDADIDKLTLAVGRDLIERLLRLPAKEGFGEGRPATTAMMNYVRKLVQERKMTDENAAWLIPRVADRRVLSFAHAKRAIEMLKTSPLLPREAVVQNREAVARNLVELGMYETPDGRIYRVQLSRAGEKYARRVTIADGKRHAEYEAGAINRLTADMRMTVERAEELSADIGECIRCGRVLTNKLSVALGIGPICRAGI